MFSAFKSLFLKNKNSIAEQIWLPLSVPINLIRLKVSNEDFINEFSKDEYLTFFFNGYLLFMTEHFFNVKNKSDKGIIVQKVMQMFDPKFKDHNELMEYQLKVGKYQSKDTIQGAEDSAITGAIMIADPKVKNRYSNNKIYLEAEKFYDNGDFHKKINMQKKVLGSLATGKNPSKMDRHFAVASIFFDLTFTKKLNKRFKIKS